MSDDRILIPQIPSTVEQRRVGIQDRLRKRYPGLEIRVDLAGDIYSIVASSEAGAFCEEASVYDSVNHTVRRLRSYFTDLAEDTDVLARRTLLPQIAEATAKQAAQARAAAQFVQPGTDIPADPSHIMDIVKIAAVDDRLSVLVNALRVGLTGSDVDLRAEHRIWGSYPHAMAAMTHPLERDARRATTLRTAGSVIPADHNGYVLDADPRKGQLHAAGRLAR